ncbi:hypothetical protein Tco_1335198 [Tanacetum coccineum]
MVDRQDLMKLYSMVDKFYQTTIATEVGLMLWGDLKVLIDSMEGGVGYSIWGSQQNWQVRSWRLYTFSNVHVLETMNGTMLYMFMDVPYPLSAKLMERMLKHKLELARDVVGNDLTTAQQLIRFIKGQLAAAQVFRVLVLANHHTANGYQSTMSHRHKDWLVQMQMTFGKDQSNPLMVARLPKTGWFSLAIFLE